MSGAITLEMTFLYHSMLLGAYITFLYDWLRIFRRVIRHADIVVSLEDLGFWIFCSLQFFCLLYRENHGILRWFAVLGALLGMVVYKAIIRNRFVAFMTVILRKLGKVVNKGAHILFGPLRILNKKYKSRIRQKGHFWRRIWKYYKKRLTIWFRMIKIMLCKQ